MRVNTPGNKSKCRTFTISRSQLVNDDGEIPEMRLGSTAGFFVRRLSEADTALLRTTLQHLDGKTITMGSTCSGTDVIVPVVEHTFAALNQIFGASRLLSLDQLLI